MAAELETREDGTAIMAVAQEPAWHGQGFVKLGERLTLEDLEREVPEWVAPVERRPVYGQVNGGMAELATHVQNVRLAAGSSPEKVVGVVGKRRYQLVQNLEAYRLASGILDLREDASIASAGVLRDGSVAILTVYLGEDYLVPGLESERRGRYLNVVNSFDASYALTAMNSDVRMVCANTLRWNLRHAPRKVAIRHSGDLEAKLDEARRALDLADRYAALQAVVAEHLVNVKVTPAKAEEFFANLVPLPMAGGQPREGRGLTNARQLREALADLYWTNPTVEPVRGTRWGLLQAVTFFTNHQQERRSTAVQDAAGNRAEARILDDSTPLEVKAQALLTTPKLTAALAAA